MTDAEIKNAIARCALSGILDSLDAALPNHAVTECDTCPDGPRSVQVVLVGPDNCPRVFEFTVRELMG